MWPSNRDRCVLPRLRSGSWIVLPVLLSLIAGCGAESAPGGPNVVLIVLDTTRADRCTVNGYERETTPNLTALARESTVFRDAWSPTSWTGPAHASLFTGLRPENHGFLRGNREHLLPESLTIAEILRDAGYRTAGFSNNFIVDRPFGLVQGFEHFVPLFADHERPYPWAPETHRRALEWAIDRHRGGERFFVFINDMEPHHPYSPPAGVAERFRRPETPDDALAWVEALDLWQIIEHNLGARRISRERVAHISDMYDAELRCLDDALGILIDGLRAEGILDETIFIVTADHGENLGDHGLLDHFFSLNRSLLQVPLIIRYPGRFEGGKEVSEVVRLEDVPPTILELCGLEVPPGLDGGSLLGDLSARMSRAILGPPATWMKRLVEEKGLGAWVEPFTRRIRSVYDGLHHLIQYSDGEEKLYDVRVDPGETHNLAGREVEILERLRSLLPEDPAAGR